MIRLLRRLWPRRRLWRLLALAAVLAGGALVSEWSLPFAPSGRELRGRASVVDGDTLVVEGVRIRLDALDAPEAAQTCERQGFAWACGRDVTQALRQRLAGREIACIGQERDRYGRLLARCRLDEEDIGAWLVREGLAVAYTRYSWRYLPQQLDARWHGRGLWAGRFDMPEEWRRRH